MNILTVYANPSPRSFCHAILEQFNRGLVEAGHTNEIVDLYAIRFDPVLKTRITPIGLMKTLRKNFSKVCC